jgi:hypothetical protein
MQGFHIKYDLTIGSSIKAVSCQSIKDFLSLSLRMAFPLQLLITIACAGWALFLPRPKA